MGVEIRIEFKGFRGIEQSRAMSRPYAGARGLFSSTYRFQSAREQPAKRRKERETGRVQGRGIQVVHNITVTAFYPAVNRAAGAPAL